MKIYLAKNMLIRSNISMSLYNRYKTNFAPSSIIPSGGSSLCLSAPSSNKFAAYKMINIRLYYFSKILQIVCDPDVLHTQSVCVRVRVCVRRISLNFFMGSLNRWIGLTLSWSAKSLCHIPVNRRIVFFFFAAIFCQASSRNTNDGQLKGDEWQIPSRIL